jgi:hypothetical protein
LVTGDKEEVEQNDERIGEGAVFVPRQRTSRQHISSVGTGASGKWQLKLTSFRNCGESNTGRSVYDLLLVVGA